MGKMSIMCDICWYQRRFSNLYAATLIARVSLNTLCTFMCRGVSLVGFPITAFNIIAKLSNGYVDDEENPKQQQQKQQQQQYGTYQRRYRNITHSPK